MNEATIFEYARLCKYYGQDCHKCPLQLSSNEMGLYCNDLIIDYPDKANEIILNWCKEHPVETRQSKLLKIFPNIKTNDKGRIYMCPQNFDWQHKCHKSAPYCDCLKCMDEYWLTEVEENE